MPTRDTPPPDRNGHADPPPGRARSTRWPRPRPCAPALAEAAARAARLVAALKQYRRERRALQAAWSSLRQLNLGP